MRRIQAAVRAALSQQGLGSGEVCVLLADDDRLRALNRTFRGVDEATDVLAFPAGTGPGLPLGDIAISVPYAERQARLRRVSLTQELAFLAIHGALHLAGLDDEDEIARARMVDQMNRAAVAAGLQPDLQWSSVLHTERAGGA